MGIGFTRATSGYREVVVRPHRARQETFLVLSMIVAIALALGLRMVSLRENGVERFIRPYQRLDATLDDAQRTLYRTLLASIADIVALRDREGLWPEALLLEREAIPPFDGRFLPANLRGYLWVGYDGGSWVDYLGQDLSAEPSVTFILRLIDLHAGYHPHPHPGIDYDPRLSVAAQVWFFPDSRRPYPGERLPESGWLWIVQADDPVLMRAPTEMGDRGD